MFLVDETEYYDQFNIRSINTYVDEAYLDENSKIDPLISSPSGYMIINYNSKI